jgi:hypothetical protein
MPAHACASPVPARSRRPRTSGPCAPIRGRGRWNKPASGFPSCTGISQHRAFRPEKSSCAHPTLKGPRTRPAGAEHRRGQRRVRDVGEGDRGAGTRRCTRDARSTACGSASDRRESDAEASATGESRNSTGVTSASGCHSTSPRERARDSCGPSGPRLVATPSVLTLRHRLKVCLFTAASVLARPSRSRTRRAASPRHGSCAGVTSLSARVRSQVPTATCGRSPSSRQRSPWRSPIVHGNHEVLGECVRA